uniref:Uncharacterized protein n=1 Tax=Cacopsylla melanoneura TaxID=428564 RepID=A0A8D8WYW0_9HEMI
MRTQMRVTTVILVPAVLKLVTRRLAPAVLVPTLVAAVLKMVPRRLRVAPLQIKARGPRRACLSCTPSFTSPCSLVYSSVKPIVRCLRRGTLSVPTPSVRLLAIC